MISIFQIPVYKDSYPRNAAIPSTAGPIQDGGVPVFLITLICVLLQQKMFLVCEATELHRSSQHVVLVSSIGKSLANVADWCPILTEHYGDFVEEECSSGLSFSSLTFFLRNRFGARTSTWIACFKFSLPH